MNIVHCKIKNKWHYIESYKKDNHWYNSKTNELIPNKLIYWIE